jgi:glutamate-1-semialdehyde aminotransferase
MECIRCRGLMVGEQFYDFERAHGFMWMKGWRCMNCGHAEDPIIAANRRLHQATVLLRLSEKSENENAHMYLRTTAVPRVAA